jgi:hypothetical protein
MCVQARASNATALALANVFHYVYLFLPKIKPELQLLSQDKLVGSISLRVHPLP